MQRRMGASETVYMIGLEKRMHDTRKRRRRGPGNKLPCLQSCMAILV